jgi:hypothetical protein
MNFAITPFCRFRPFCPFCRFFDEFDRWLAYAMQLYATTAIRGCKIDIVRLLFICYQANRPGI